MNIPCTTLLIRGIMHANDKSEDFQEANLDLTLSTTC